MIFCPACQEAMREVQFSGITVDECRFCDGLWLDNGEPEKLVCSLDVIPKHLLQPIAMDDSMRVNKAGERPCPRCALILKTMQYREVEIEVCLECRGLWLDRWELQKILQ